MLVFLTHLSAWETGREAARRRQRAAERDPRWFSEQKKASAWKRSKRVDVDMAGPLCHTRVGNCTFVCFPLFFLCPPPIYVRLVWIPSYCICFFCGWGLARGPQEKGVQQ